MCVTLEDKVSTCFQEMGPVEPQKDKDHAHEEEPHNLPIGVGIKDLRKVFKVINVWIHIFSGCLRMR